VHHPGAAADAERVAVVLGIAVGAPERAAVHPAFPVALGLAVGAAVAVPVTKTFA
jgi:hypothetical protein